MNFIQRLYCRTFQCCFRIAIPWLPYRKPQTITQLEQLPEVLRREGCRRVLLVTDQDEILITEGIADRFSLSDGRTETVRVLEK